MPSTRIVPIDAPLPGRQRDRPTGRDDPRPVGVAEQDVVVLGQEARRGRRVRVGPRRVGQVEQLASRSVPEGDELGSQRVDDRARVG